MLLPTAPGEKNRDTEKERERRMAKGAKESTRNSHTHTHTSLKPPGEGDIINDSRHRLKILLLKALLWPVSMTALQLVIERCLWHETSAAASWTALA